jgi:hypothetical protein
MKLVFAAGVTFLSGELSEPSPSFVNCRPGEDDVPVLKAAYCHASYSPLGDFSGDYFAFFLLELRVDLGAYNEVLLVLLVLLLIYPDVRMPAKPLFFLLLLLLLCIEISKRDMLLCGERFGGVWKS